MIHPDIPTDAPSVRARQRLIVALDLPNAHAALALIERLEDSCEWVKVGLELYLASGNAIVETLIRRGHSVFLDLKLHDIPNTVAGAVRSVSDLGVSMLTLHAAGGAAMMRAAVDAAHTHTSAPRLLAVTVLTSMDKGQLHATGIDAAPGDQVVRLARLAHDSGIDGFVCSAHEAETLRRTVGREPIREPILVVPGIRPARPEPAGSASPEVAASTFAAHSDDQRRVATPADAIRAGASYLVVGRPITQSPDPLAAARAILAEIEAALPGR